MILISLQEFYGFIKPDKPVLSLDYGQKKIGIAISVQKHSFFMPMQTIHATDTEQKIQKLQEIFATHHPCAIVLGYPVNLDGSIGKQAAEVEKFAELLDSKTALPIFLQDERLTSRAAHQMLRGAGFTRKERHTKDDAIAAQLILETALYQYKPN